MAVAALLLVVALAQPSPDADPFRPPPPDPFRQLDDLLPTPNEQRTASGAPGRGYWQNRADMEIDVALDETTRRLVGSERIVYRNASPDTLRYLWLQLDANIHRPESWGNLAETAPALDRISPKALKRLVAETRFDGGVEIRRVEDGAGRPLPHVVVDTMMRIDLPVPLAPHAEQVLRIDWTYVINRSDEVGGRSAAEWFEDDGNWIFDVAQWFPRLCRYTDVRGWNHKQFLGRGEFALEFGDYLVRITVPADHVVAATGVLQNPEDVLSPERRERLERARTAERPVLVVTPAEAAANEASRAAETRTWIFRAENVRDFSWASSRKFAWDAWGVPIDGRTVMAMSFFPREGEPLWSRYSTQAVAHTLEVYSRFGLPYPYPVAQSVNGPVGGMEYPMISFNGPRPEKDGTYSELTKHALIGVVIHEVGHNWFPMIVNSDERQWTWMDEGLNTFVQFLAEQEWQDDYPSRRGHPRFIVPYMTSTDQVPIMTNSESLRQFGNNAYAKPATALNVLRETILGRELFDHAFREYCRRWRFRSPEPADLFRTLEDASGVDLDWFWRGWFHTTDHVDLAIERVRLLRAAKPDLDADAEDDRTEDAEEPTGVTTERNAEVEKRIDRFPELRDFWNEHDRFEVTPRERADWAEFLARLEDDEAEWLDGQGLLFYVVDFRNVGGLVMPLLLEIEYEDGSRRSLRIPAEIWARDPVRTSKLLVEEKPIARIRLDPSNETADADMSNNAYPPEIDRSRFRVFKEERVPNLMQQLEGKLREEDVRRDER